MKNVQSGFPKEFAALPERVRGELAEFLRISAGKPDPALEERLADSLALRLHLSAERRH
jgi:hypothetical protein